MSKVETCYKRDESSIKICPAWVIYSMPLVFGVMVLCFVITIINFRKISGQISFGILVFCFLWSILSDKIYSMYENCRITFKKDCVVYTYDLNRSVMPSSNVTTTVTISEISKIKVKRNMIVLKGRIIRRAPLKGETRLSKIELPINFKEKDIIVEKLKERVSD